MKLTPEALTALRENAKTITTTATAPCLCGKLLDVATWTRKWYSGHKATPDSPAVPGVNYTDLLCEDCRKNYQGLSRIVCLGCRSLTGFFKPGKQATGFVFERNRHYHIADCPTCVPARRSTPVLEHERFCRANGIPTSTNPDLLQEIETKVLQGERDAANLRKEFEDSVRK